MGSWGTGINQNDAFADAYDDFYDTYNRGASPEVATSKVMDLLSKDRDEDSHNFLFALAYAQWETKSLTTDVLEQVKSIVESGDDLKLWEALGATEDTLNERKVALDLFLRELLSERKTKKRRKKKKFDFRSDTLIEVAAPDNKKYFSASESYRDGVYIHTLGCICWETSGGSIFHFKKEGAKVNAIWENSNSLKIYTDQDVIFSQKDSSGQSYTGIVEVTYFNIED